MREVFKYVRNSYQKGRNNLFSMAPVEKRCSEFKFQQGRFCLDIWEATL